MDSILQGRFLTRIPKIWNLTVLLFLGFVISIILSVVRALMKVLFFIIVLTICVALTAVLFIYAGVWLDLFSPMLVSTSVFLCITSHDYFHSLLYEQMVRKELSIARQIQMRLLPKEEPHLKGFDISALSEPHSSVGGDYYDFINLDKDRLGIAIGDASGKGVPASLLVTTSRAALRAYMENVGTLADVLVKLNNFVYRDTDSDKFVTLFCCILNVSDKKLIYSNAGHNSPLLYRSKDGSFEALESHGMPLGMFEGAPYDESEIDLADGDILVIYTDGVTEAENKREEKMAKNKLSTRGISISRFCFANPCSLILVSIVTLTFTSFASAQTDIKLPHEKTIGRGVLNISSKPVGAKVFLNGEFVGHTPTKAPDLIPGTYEVKVTKINHGTGIKKVFVKEDQNIDVSLKLPNRTNPIGTAIALLGIISVLIALEH
ncbi:TPA: PEGA domain-containing protein [Candidatus Poribacteria bacterium]|nr:PEGA domain-containing protein [Candidatus Poribacteria bacterium]